ncbi:G-protein coupled receptor GRL101-like isoform X2 [Pomacea canaliculata]|uniref:G-protein coupled receptor GRL101-like isoform X2 n=1 Tax=Pomacea canaliculata TaxID=400727 RepID=UPI000D735B01|nr:G-protein coupled receptor GRL101-like isoform X2 [Pomacea canaliculata]
MLEINYTTATQGFVQTPNWIGRTRYPLMDSWAEIPIPRHHQIMVSFQEVDIGGSEECRHDKISLYSEGHLNSSLIHEICTTHKPPVSLYNVSKLYIHFKSVTFYPGTGFRLSFSFHALSALPQQLRDGRWNCSVPHWPDFRLHFPCNLVSDCVGGEDEVDCPYTSHVCGPGFQSANGTCLQFVKTDRNISWKAASEICKSRGMLLMAAQTPTEWAATLDLLRYRPFERSFYGLVLSPPSLPYMYSQGFTGLDGIFIHFLPVDFYYGISGCFGIRFRPKDILDIFLPLCDINMASLLICKFAVSGDDTLPQMPVSLTANWSVDVLQCPSLHYTHTFLACDVESECWADKYDNAKTCSTPLTSLPPSFSCINEIQRVPYSLVCDHRPDCSDNSDENFCIFFTCPLNKKLFECSNKQCIPDHFRCDHFWHCADGLDELMCIHQEYIHVKKSHPPPAIIDIDSNGRLKAVEPITMKEKIMCPETHFQCPGVDFYCLPVYVRCNGVFDCPGKQDETACDTYTCPGYYRCRSSHVCLHPDHVCDGWSQCPEGDDELLCDLSCPDTCVCHGLAFTCTQRFAAINYPELRYLDASGSGMTPRDVVNNTMIVYLSFNNCNISVLDQMNFVNLQILDLSNNYITSFSSNIFGTLHNLRSLDLSGNPLASLNPTDRPSHPALGQVIGLDVSRIKFSILDVMISETFPNLRKLNLSDCGVETIAGELFTNLTELRSLDLKGSTVNYFPPQTFTSLSKLESLYADNYKVCCPASLPEGFILQKCEAPSDEISSCDALLRSDTYRVFLSLFASLALMGNAGSFIYRVFISKKTSNLGFDVFVTNLSIADFVMGVYLAIIGIADRVYLENYLWNDLIWRNSFVCKLAGFLCLLSSEVSAFIILLVTLDRLLVINFPFSVFHFVKRSAWIASVMTWSVGFIIALIPLLPSTADWNFYNKNGICIPISIANKDFYGKDYATGIMIILNGILFLFIAAGQFFIFLSVRINSIPNSDTSKKTKDLTIARRLMTVVVSDFCCKFPVALLGLLAARGTPVSSEVIVALVIFIVPLNSALNPFLYTLNVLIERRRKSKEMMLKKHLISLLEQKNLSK